jgi:hypothetical protein
VSIAGNARVGNPHILVLIVGGAWRLLERIKKYQFHMLYLEKVLVGLELRVEHENATLHIQVTLEIENRKTRKDPGKMRKLDIA